MPFPISLIPAIFQAGTGLTQLFGGDSELADLKRPEYKIPTEAKMALGLSKSEFADPRFAGQSQLEQQTQQNLAQALEAAQNRGSGMQQVGQIAATGNQAAQDIGAEAARQQRSDLGSYQNMLKLMSDYREKAFQMNEYAPYMDKYNESRERIGAGQENIFGSLDKMATVMNRMLGAGGQGPTPAQSAASALQSSQFSNFWDKKLSQAMRYF